MSLHLTCEYHWLFLLDNLLTLLIQSLSICLLLIRVEHLAATLFLPVRLRRTILSRSTSLPLVFAILFIVLSTISSFFSLLARFQLHSNHTE